MTRLPSGDLEALAATPGVTPTDPGEEPTASDVFSQFGAEPIAFQIAESPGDLVSEVGGVAPPSVPSASQVFSQFGAEPVAKSEPATTPSPAGAVPAQDPGETSKVQSTDPRDSSDLDKSRSMLQKGAEFLSRMDPSDPRFPRMKADFENQVATQSRLERESELASQITFGGVPVKDDPAFRNQIGAVRRLEEIATRWTGTVQTTTLRALGKEKEALALTQSINRLSEYNALLARDSSLGKTAGPLVEQIGTVLGVGTLNALTGGVTGVASLFALEDFNQGMLEAKDQTPVQQLQHAGTRAAITLGTTLVGGRIAEKAGVAIGESVAPVFGKAASQLFTKSGLKDIALASTIEGGEEAVQSLLTAAENARSGVDPDATDNLFSKVLKDAALGALVGTVAQVSTSAAQLDIPTQHFSDLMDGWARRVKNNPVPKPAIVDSTKSKFAQTSEGKLISRETVDAELHVLSQLEQEIQSQFESGGARELKQSIVEREADLKGTQEDIRDLNVRMRESVTPERKANLRKRLDILKKYKKEVRSRLGADKTQLETWRGEFEKVHKGEREYIDEELGRLTKQQELPDPDTEVASPTNKDGENKPSDTKGDGPTKPGDKQTPPTDVVTKDQSPDSEPAPKDTLVSDLTVDSRRAEQKHVKRVRDFLKLDKVVARKSQATDLAFSRAREQNLHTREGAGDLAESVLRNGNILGSVELAGLQTRYVDAFDLFAENNKFLSKNPNIAEDALLAREQEGTALLSELNTLSDAWIKTSSEAGAALQAQQRVLGEVYSRERATTKAKRAKGEDLTAKEITELDGLSQEVQKAAEKVAGEEKGTEAFDRADKALSDAIIEYNATIELKKPRSRVLKGVEAFNSVAMRLTLSGDLPPLGRAGAFNLFANPKQTYKNIGTFFESFLNRKVADAEFQGFLAERSIREMPNFRVLHKDFGVPIQARDTPFQEVEGSVQGRVVQALRGLPGLKNLGNLPGAQFEIAYRSWTNQQRFSLADIAYEGNKDVLLQAGGKEEMQKIIDHTMLATGHSSIDLGSPGQVLLTAPRYLISRILLPAKALPHLIKGGIATAQGKQNAERYIAKQYVKAIVGATALTSAIQAAASLAFGSENVSLDRDPTSGTFGYLEVNGRLFDMTGGTGFMLRSLVRGARGAREVAFGEDKIRDTDVAQVVGGTLESRTSPAARLATYLVQSGVPAGEREKQGVAEYVLRNSTYLSAQALFDSAKSEGLDDSAFTTLLELWGVTSFEKK